MIKKLKFITRIILIIIFLIVLFLANIITFNKGNDTQITMIILWDVVILMKMIIWAWE